MVKKMPPHRKKSKPLQMKLRMRLAVIRLKVPEMTKRKAKKETEEKALAFLRKIYCLRPKKSQVMRESLL